MFAVQFTLGILKWKFVHSIGCFTIFAINVYDCPESEISKIPYLFVTLYLMSTFNLKGPKLLLNLLHL